MKKKNSKYKGFGAKYKQPDKRGMLLASETLKMILAVICLSFLIYLLTSLYFANIDGKKKEQAIATMERVKNIVSAIEAGNKTEEAVYDIAIPGWDIFSFTGNETKPNSCSGMSCLCFCDEVFADYFDSQVKECSSDGVCYILENLEEFENIKISSASSTTSINIKKDGNFWKISKLEIGAESDLK